MISLQPPSAIPDDDAYLATICNQNAWASSHHAQWLAAYNHYRTHLGNPWVVATSTFLPNIDKEQYALYDTRRSGKRIRAVRNMPNLLCCPMCGSEMTGSLDHFLPRDIFPEFSVMLANLVPACSHCNSSAKKSTYKGTYPESFIHPYFETLAASPIWLIEVVRPLVAVTFKPRVLPSVPRSDSKRVAFHLKNILGNQFHLWAANRWATLPQVIRNAVGVSGTVSTVQVQSELTKQLAQANATTGLNSWLSAFFRGLQSDSEAHTFIANAAHPLTTTFPA